MLFWLRLPILIGIIAAFGVGVVLGGGVPLVAASTAAAVLSERSLGGRRADDGRASALAWECDRVGGGEHAESDRPLRLRRLLAAGARLAEVLPKEE